MVVRADLVVQQARPMLAEFLADIGLCQPGMPLDLKHALGPFSDWLDGQVIEEHDRWYLASRLGAFICEYLIDIHSAERLIVDGKIVMHLPVQEGVQREFDPYQVAIGMVTSRSSLKTFLHELGS